MRTEFIVKIYEESKRVQPNEVSNEELRKIVNDIRKFLNRNEEEHKTNRSAIGFKHLFRGFIIKEWSGFNMM